MTTTEPTLQPPIPAAERPANRTPDFKAVLSVLFCGVLATMLNSHRLVEVAGRLEFGPDRDRWLNAALVIDDAASDLYLDMPAEWSDALIDSDAPEAQVVIGELATTWASTIPPRLALESQKQPEVEAEPTPGDSNGDELSVPDSN